MFLYSCRFSGLCNDFNFFRALSYVCTNKSLPITLCNIVAVLDIGFSALNSITFSRLSIDFLFGLISLQRVDSCTGGEIVKSVVIEILESVSKVLFRSESCLVQVNGGNLFFLMSDGSGL